MSLFKKFFGGFSPGLDHLQLDQPAWAFQGRRENANIWHTPRGDGVGIFFFDLEPDLPLANSAGEFFAEYQGRVGEGGARWVEGEIVTVAEVSAVRTIIKVPQTPSGMTYVGSYTLPFKEYSFVVKIQCAEHGVTGVREAVLLAEGPLARNDADTLSEGWSTDAAEYDERFPDHPLARVRSNLPLIVEALRVDPRLLTLPTFPLPLQ